MSGLDEKKQQATQWFRQLRDEICASYEQLEDELSGTDARREAGRFTYTPWSREPQGRPAGRPGPEHASVREQEASTGSHLNNGGEMGTMKGRLFEKVGVNISVVEGAFDEKFRAEIPGASEDPRFWAAGISLVAHMHSPLVPAAHFNTRMIVIGGESQTEQEASRGSHYRLWFGGGGDLNPMYPDDQDTADFHQAFRDACDPFDPALYPAFANWCDEYFYIPHRDMTRGVGGIFYDYLGLNTLYPHPAPLPKGEGSVRYAQANGEQENLSHWERSKRDSVSGEGKIDLTKFGKGGVGKEKTLAGMEIAANAALDWNQAFAFTQAVGRAFRDIYPALIRRHMHTPWTAEQREWQLQKRGWYAEYNLLYDRGTRFGLMTGGNTDAILMSLPPVAKWP